MTTNITKDGDKMTIEVGGRLDVISSAELDKIIKESIVGITDLTIDIDKLTYISSAGLRVLLSAQQTMDDVGSMRIIHVHDNIMEILDMIGFTEFLTLE